MKELYSKYKIEKTSGESIDPAAQYFVLRPDADPAARAAMLTYAAEVERDGEVDMRLTGPVSPLSKAQRRARPTRQGAPKRRR